MTKMFGRQNSSTKTILLRSPDSDRVREVVITEIVVPNSRNSVDKLSFVDRMDTKIMSKPSRKRRLDHLSQEEKIMRKKLKNREAAQTSRDRKKAKLEELESAVRLLQKQNSKLCDEVESLRMERDGLQRENAALSDELWRLRVEGGGPPTPKGGPPSAVKTDGPAVSSENPLPQGTAPQPLPARHLPANRRAPPLLHRLSRFPLLRLLFLLSWQTLLMTSSTVGLAATKLAHLISKSSNCLLIHCSSRPLLLRKLIIQLKNPSQTYLETPWISRDRPPPAPFLDSVTLKMICHHLVNHPTLLAL